MAKKRSSSGRPKNRLLASLPDDDFRRILQHLRTVAVQLRLVFHKQGEPIRHVYFPNGGVCSVTAVLSSGESVEAATVGDEGNGRDRSILYKLSRRAG